MAINDYLIPLVVGVTGHRTIDETDAQLLGLVSEEFISLREAFRHTPFVVLSPLAEGADRMVARLAMEHLHARLVVPLPLPLDEYRKDFATEKSRQEFAELLRQADPWFELPLQESPAAVAGPGEARARQYARVGAYIVEHCQILLALWDGQDARGTGGTAHIVRWKSAGEAPPEFSSHGDDRCTLNQPDIGVIGHINPVTYQVVTPATPAEGSLPHAIFSKINDFNQNVRAYVHNYGEDLFTESKQDLLGKEEKNTIVTDHKIFQRLLSVYAAADRLSRHFQKQDRRITRCIYATFFIALMAYGLIDLRPWLVVAHVISIPLIGLLIYWARKKKMGDRFLDYRALAEGLRVLAFWQLCGIKEKVSSHYLSKHIGILSWIRQAIRTMEYTSAFDETQHNQVKNRAALDLAKNLWVQGQLTFFAPRRENFSKWSRHLGRISTTSFVLTLVIAAMYFFFILKGWTDDKTALPNYFWKAWIDKNSDLHNYFQAALGATGALGVAAEAYKKRRAFAELEKQYALTRQVFASAQERLMEPQCIPEQIFFLLGKEALMENGEWLWTHRNLPLEIPKG